ncbi:hypothetical protein FO519_008692 [Halicephalobus sp. NKZ332]|nr:hypothetical protein FO519_008692 [Halicephalobus sp. NKZ332]
MQNRSRPRRSNNADHVVETRSRTKATPPEAMQNGKKRLKSNEFLSDEPSPSGLSNGHSEIHPLSSPKISPRKLRELQELTEMSKWMDPEDGKHQRTTRRSLMCQRTSPRSPTLLIRETPSSEVTARMTRSMRAMGDFKSEPDTPEPVRPKKIPDSVLDTPKLPNGILKKPGQKDKKRDHVQYKITEPPAKKIKLKIKLQPPPKKAKNIQKKQKSKLKSKKTKPTKRVVFKGPLRRLPRDPMKVLRKFVKKVKKSKKKSVKKSSSKGKRGRKSRKQSPQKTIQDVLGVKIDSLQYDKTKVQRSMEKIRNFYRRKLISKIPLLFQRDRLPIKRTLRLKRLANARSLLPIPRRKLKSHPKFRVAKNPVKSIPLKKGIKWLSLLTPCQRSCNCRGFRKDEIMWKFKMVHAKEIHGLQAEDLCTRCGHPLWQHRRKYSPEDRRDRYAVVRDIRILQNFMLKEKNNEKLRVYFLLWKDLISIIVENTPVPMKLYPSKRVLESNVSIKKALQMYMESKEAKKFGFINKNALDFLKTLDDFRYPPPNKTNLIFDIMGYHFIYFLDQYIALKFEEKYAKTGDPGVKIIGVLFKKFVEFAKEIKTISKRQVKRHPLRGEGENVLADNYVSDPDNSGMGTRHAPLVSRLLTEHSGPDFFKDLSPPAPMKTLQLEEPLRICHLIWKAKLRSELNQFLPKKRKTKNIKFLRDPDTLEDFKELSEAIRKKKEKRYFNSNCDKERDSGKIELFLLRNQRNAREVKRNEFLMQFVTVIHRQLPKMPKHYILKLVMDRHHRSLILVKHNKRGANPGWTVLGGICFRPFIKQKFSEVVFVAVHADHQVRGYGGYMMDHLKRIHVEQLGYPHLLTFADKNAIGYFKKQGFSKESEVPKNVYGKFIKEYDSATLMYCHSRICNTKDDILYWSKKLGRVLINIHKINCPEWYSKKDNLREKFIKYDLLPMNVDRAEKIDQVGYGLTEEDIGLPKLFWQEQYEKIWRLPHFENVTSEDEKLGEDSDEEMPIFDEKEIYRKAKDGKEWNSDEEEDLVKMFMLLEALYRCPFSWPFHYPVDEYYAPTYYEEIVRPMTLEMVEDRLHWGYFVSVEQFLIDLNAMFSNCYYFNTQLDSFYYHSGFRLHQYYNAMAVQIFGDHVKRVLLPIPKKKPTIRRIVPRNGTFTFAPPKPYWYPMVKEMPVQERPKKTKRRRRNSAVVRVGKRRNRPKKLILRKIKPDKKKKKSTVNGDKKVNTVDNNEKNKKENSVQKKSPIKIKLKAPMIPRTKNQPQPEISDDNEKRETRASTRQATYISKKTAPARRIRYR